MAPEDTVPPVCPEAFVPICAPVLFAPLSWPEAPSLPVDPCTGLPEVLTPPSTRGALAPCSQKRTLATTSMPAASAPTAATPSRTPDTTSRRRFDTVGAATGPPHACCWPGAIGPPHCCAGGT